MTAWTVIENPGTGGTARVPQSSLGLYEAAGWEPVPTEPPAEPPEPEPVPAAGPGTSTPDTPEQLPGDGSTDNEE